MADDQSSDRKLPTTGQVREILRNTLSTCRARNWDYTLTADYISKMLETAGALSVAPEPVAPEPSELFTLVRDDADVVYERRFTTGDRPWRRLFDVTVNERCWFGWADMAHPVGVFRLVDTPEPAPKYTATRDSDGSIRVDGGGGIFNYWGATRETVERALARDQAALDLIKREEAGNA